MLRNLVVFTNLTCGYISYSQCNEQGYKFSLTQPIKLSNKVHKDHNIVPAFSNLLFAAAFSILFTLESLISPGNAEGCDSIDCNTIITSNLDDIGVDKRIIAF